jgi:hypothetical protein
MFVRYPLQECATGKFFATARLFGSAQACTSCAAGQKSAAATGSTACTSCEAGKILARSAEVSGITLTSVAGGTGYSSGPTVSFSGGGGAAATAAVATGAVTSITVTAGGSGYTSAPTVVLSASAGSSAAATATVSGGAVTSIAVNNGGTNYPSGGVTVSFYGGGGAAAATASVASDAVTTFAVTAGGSYTSAPTVVLTHATGSSAAATASVATDFKTGDTCISCVVTGKYIEKTVNSGIEATGGSDSDCNTCAPGYYATTANCAVMSHAPDRMPCSCCLTPLLTSLLMVLPMLSVAFATRAAVP